MFPFVLKIMVPCRDELPFFVAKEASGKTPKAPLACGIGTVKRVTWMSFGLQQNSIGFQ